MPISDRLEHNFTKETDPTLQTERRRRLSCDKAFWSASRFNRICWRCTAAHMRTRCREALDEGTSINA